MTATRLTEQQLAQFDIFGYLGFPSRSADRADAISAAFEAVWASHGGGHDGKPHDGKARSVVVQFADQNEYLSTLLDDPRIHDIGPASWVMTSTTWAATATITWVTRAGIPTAMAGAAV